MTEHKRKTINRPYDNASTVDNELQILAEFKNRSSACYQQLHCVQDIAYADHERLCLDVFPLPQAKSTVIFIHGGYWQYCDKSDFAFISTALLAKNYQCVLLEYDLAPQSSLQNIVSQVQDGFDFIQKQAWMTPEVIVLGHSAGAHLAALMRDHPLVSRTILLSGIYDLAPIKHSHLNEALNLTDFEIQHYSPILKSNTSNTACEIYCGAQELAELRWQSQHYYQHCLAQGQENCALSILPDCNHYTILDTFLAQFPSAPSDAPCISSNQIT
ncbi:acetyl esterase/lipase [Acinetobacter calcoaceticus]|uniref:Acetyl esterase/lipase n=1 Tax=Acinetobacter calcoaceticus TaxID=471 RepID=A0A4R1XSX9_ACICA|nr:acetyl esterase/lipase [Acinetobacter calcoaceticus]